VAVVDVDCVEVDFTLPCLCFVLVMELESAVVVAPVASVVLAEEFVSTVLLCFFDLTRVVEDESDDCAGGGGGAS